MRARVIFSKHVLLPMFCFIPFDTSVFSFRIQVKLFTIHLYAVFRIILSVGLKSIDSSFFADVFQQLRTSVHMPCCIVNCYSGFFSV